MHVSRLTKTQPYLSAAAEDAGALEVLVSVFTGPPGPKPEPLLESTQAPVLILWGDTDPLTPVDVRVPLLSACATKST
jgi:pimeloyl-ACP methyl ester carboxylesterase